MRAVFITLCFIDYARADSCRSLCAFSSACLINDGSYCKTNQNPAVCKGFYYVTGDRNSLYFHTESSDLSENWPLKCTEADNLMIEYSQLLYAVSESPEGESWSDSSVISDTSTSSTISELELRLSPVRSLDRFIYPTGLPVNQAYPITRRHGDMTE